MPRLENILGASQLRDLAERGAEARIAEIKAEIISIHNAFPNLGVWSGENPFPWNFDNKRSIRRPKKRGGMSAAGRRAVSERMKKYWANKKKSKNK